MSKPITKEMLKDVLLRIKKVLMEERGAVSNGAIMKQTNLEKLLSALNWAGGTAAQVNTELLRLGYLGASKDFLKCSDTVVDYICNTIRRYDAGLMFKGEK